MGKDHVHNISRRKLYYSQSLDENCSGQVSFSVKVKGQGPFSILTEFDRGRRCAGTEGMGVTPPWLSKSQVLFLDNQEARPRKPP